MPSSENGLTLEERYEKEFHTKPESVLEISEEDEDNEGQTTSINEVDKRERYEWLETSSDSKLKELRVELEFNIRRSEKNIAGIRRKIENSTATKEDEEILSILEKSSEEYKEVLNLIEQKLWFLDKKKETKQYEWLDSYSDDQLAELSTELEGYIRSNIKGITEIERRIEDGTATSKDLELLPALQNFTGEYRTVFDIIKTKRKIGVEKKVRNQG